MRDTSRFRRIVPLLLAAWIVLLAAGLKLQMDYERTPGTSGPARELWPAESRFDRTAAAPQLVLFAHPQCPCTRSTLDVLEALRARFPGAFRATVAFVQPEGTTDEWVRGDLWRKAAAMKGIDARVDVGGRESRRFGARTSGHVFLYDGSGRLRFEGGITPGRGAAGDSAGRRAVAALLSGGTPSDPVSSVFGCSLDSSLGNR